MSVLLEISSKSSNLDDFKSAIFLLEDRPYVVNYENMAAYNRPLTIIFKNQFFSKNGPLH